MMTREEVINGLQEVIDCEIIVYLYRVEAIECAIEMLKAQGPRVLDFGEIQTMSNADVFFEERSSSLVYPLLLMGVENSNKSQKAFFIPMTAKPLRPYGKTWRCWTSRPTDAQREAVKWE